MHVVSAAHSNSFCVCLVHGCPAIAIIMPTAGVYACAVLCRYWLHWVSTWCMSKPHMHELLHANNSMHWGSIWCMSSCLPEGSKAQLCIALGLRCSSQFLPLSWQDGSLLLQHSYCSLLGHVCAREGSNGGSRCEGSAALPALVHAMSSSWDTCMLLQFVPSL